MKSKKTLFFASLIIVPIVLFGVFLLFFLNTNTTANGFKRTIGKRDMKVIGETQYPGIITAIVGMTADHIYFATSNPTMLLQTKYDLTEQKPIEIKYNSTQSLKDSYNVEVDSPMVKIYGGNLQIVISSVIGDIDSARALKLQGTIFNQAAYLPSGNLIIRQYEPKVKDFVFAKYDKNGHQIGSENNLSNSMADDGISSQGILLYNRQHQSLIYVHRMINRLYAFDTSLNLLFNSRTVDTFSIPNTTVRGYKDGKINVKTFAAPPRYVNGVAATDGDRVYINSLLKADNDSESNFASKPTIDVYDLKGGTYQHSFYIPGFNQQKLTAIKIKGNTLVVVYGFGRHISSFEFN